MLWATNTSSRFWPCSLYEASRSVTSLSNSLPRLKISSCPGTRCPSDIRVGNPQVSILASQHRSGSRSVGQNVPRSQASSASLSSPAPAAAHRSSAGSDCFNGLCRLSSCARGPRREPRRGARPDLVTATLSDDNKPPEPSEKSSERGRSGDPNTRSRGGASPFRGFLSVLPFFWFGEARCFRDRARTGSFSDEVRFAVDAPTFGDEYSLLGTSLAGVCSHVFTGWPPRPCTRMMLGCGQSRTMRVRSKYLTRG